MSDTACGKLRMAFPAGTDPAIIACETAAWQAFANSCGECGGQQTCIDLKYAQYLTQRAKCAEGGDT